MDWLKQIFDKLLSFIPRIWLMSPNEAGVRITLGKYVKDVEAGWYIYLPMIQEIQAIVITPQIVDLKSQSVITKDGKDLCISGAIMYRVRDASLSILKVHDYDESIRTLSLGIIAEYTSRHDFISCRDLEAITDWVLKGIKENARGWGLDIMKVFITDIGTTRNLRLLTDLIRTPLQQI